MTQPQDIDPLLKRDLTEMRKRAISQRDTLKQQLAAAEADVELLTRIHDTIIPPTPKGSK